MRIARRGLIVIGVAALALVVSGCPTDPPAPPHPAGPVWTSHHSGGPPAGGVTPWTMAIGTTTGWYAQFDIDAPLNEPGTVSLFPRSGSNGDTLGTPQVFSANTIGLSGGVLSEHVLLTGSLPGGPSTDLQFFAESGGAWAPAGTFALASGETIRGMTDDVLVTQFWGPTSSEIRVYTLTLAGGTVTVTGSHSLFPPAAWGPGYGLYWGGVASLDGDLLVVHAHNEAIGVLDQVAVYRRSGGTFELEASLERADFDSFGIRLAVDDRPGTDRLVIGGYPDGSAMASVVTYTSAGGVWTPETTLVPPAGVTDDAAWQYFGQAIALDGDVMVITARAQAITPPGPGGAARVAYQPLVYRHTAAGWTYETALSVVPAPVDSDGLNRALLSMVVSGSHIVGTNGVGLPATCSFCFSARFEAWRWDRSPA